MKPTTTQRSLAFLYMMLVPSGIRNALVYAQTKVIGTAFALYKALKSFTARKQKLSAFSPAESKTDVHFIFPGCGLFFFWQAGFMAYLLEQNYDLNTGSISFTGASAGAMTAVLSVLGVDFANATQILIKICEEAGVLDNVWGLQGTWGSITYKWLDQLLPADAHKKAEQSNVSMLITPVSNLRNPEKVQTYSSRNELIESIMATVHIPWFMDGNWTTTFRGRKYIDGALFSRKKHYLPDNKGADVIVLNHFKDPHYKGFGLLDTIKVMTPQAVWDMMEHGKAHARRMEAEGRFVNIPKIEQRAQ